MADLNQLVEKALNALEGTLALPIPELQVPAAAAILEFAAAMSRQALVESHGCKHEQRTNMTTMGGGPVIEICKLCGVRLENGVEVKG